MFELSDSDININLISSVKNNKNIFLNGGNNIELVKGGFPRIKICDNEIIKKITEKKQREFSNKNIISIKDMINSKKSESLIDLITEPNIFINKENRKNLNLVNLESEKKINNISIDIIIGKK
jgi:hypothetical protein